MQSNILKLRSCAKTAQNGEDLPAMTYLVKNNKGILNTVCEVYVVWQGSVAIYAYWLEDLQCGQSKLLLWAN